MKNYSAFTRSIKALLVVLALLMVATPANAFCFKEIGGVFHKSKVEHTAPLPVQIRPAGSQVKPDSFCKVVGRSVAITLVVQTVVIGAKIGLGLFTGVLIL